MIGPMLDSVLATGRATWSVDTELYFDRKLSKEEVYVTWSYVPILAADGQSVDGIFNPCVETTEKVIGARRLETLRTIGLKPAEARTVDSACQAAVDALATNGRDIPFAAIYVVDERTKEATLRASMLPHRSRCAVRPSKRQVPPAPTESVARMPKPLGALRDAHCGRAQTRVAVHARALGATDA
jgi:hypothetical protein